MGSRTQIKLLLMFCCRVRVVVDAVSVCCSTNIKVFIVSISPIIQSTSADCNQHTKRRLQHHCKGSNAICGASHYWVNPECASNVSNQLLCRDICYTFSFKLFKFFHTCEKNAWLYRSDALKLCKGCCLLPTSGRFPARLIGELL